MHSHNASINKTFACSNVLKIYIGAGISLWKSPCCNAILNTEAEMDIVAHNLNLVMWLERAARQRWK